MKILIVCTIVLGLLLGLLWVCRRLFVRRIEDAYYHLSDLRRLTRAIPEGHVPKITKDYALCRVDDYREVLESGLYPNDEMLRQLAEQCTWLHNPDDFRMMFP